MLSRAVCPVCARPVAWRELGWSSQCNCRGCGSELIIARRRGSRGGFRTALALLRDLLIIVFAVVMGAIYGFLSGLLFWVAGLLSTLFCARVCRPFFCTLRPVKSSPVCGKCGYDLRGSPGPNCPECGDRFMSWAPRRPPEVQQHSAEG